MTPDSHHNMKFGTIHSTITVDQIMFCQHEARNSRPKPTNQNPPEYHLPFQQQAPSKNSGVLKQTAPTQTPKTTHPISPSRLDATAADEAHRSPHQGPTGPRHELAAKKPDPKKLPKQRSEPVAMESQRLFGHPQPAAEPPGTRREGPSRHQSTTPDPNWVEVAEKTPAGGRI
ncbi:GTP-binding protein Obg/CgtA [Striga asiatica]|uniref:GTP-binding protein Obg/CgtA n=1 Tax=Striga asiatica TaxID=4170 RepID=A0A5A7R2J4_STRAF|nr:GTP-binding protein Obg/CgtA [Striga asiatica]